MYKMELGGELERRGCDKHTHTHKSKLHCQRVWSVALGGVIFSKRTSNVRRRLDAQSVPLISRNKQNSTASRGECASVCDFHTRRPQSSHQHKQRCEGSKQSGQEVWRHLFSASFSLSLMISCFPYIPSYIIWRRSTAFGFASTFYIGIKWRLNTAQIFVQKSTK